MISNDAADIIMTNKDASCSGRRQTDSVDDVGESTASVTYVTGVQVCAGCRRPIHDQYMLHVQPGLDWHSSCLRCAECCQTLDENCTCFVRDGRAFCKRDYNRLFGVKCHGCGLGFDKMSLVMRARDRIYHIDCFRCVTCERRLVSGDEFALRPSDGGLVCRDHCDSEASPAALHGLPPPSLSVAADLLPAVESAVINCVIDVSEELEADAAAAHSSLTSSTGKTKTKHVSSGNNNNNNRDNNSKNKLNHAGNSSPQTSSTSGGGGGKKKQAGGSGNGSSRHVTSRGGKSESHHGGSTKTTRIRTVLNEKQLHTLRTCYAANPRPDALMKDQLVEMTGLSSRVIRVWFQNKRCKDKKRTILIKQLQQQHHDKAHGVPMIASSPVRMQDQNQAMLQVSAVQVHHQYVQHAAALSSESPVTILQSQSSLPMTGAAAPPAGHPTSISWSTAGGPSCLPAAIVDYGGGSTATTTSLMFDDSDLDVTPSTAAFQQLLDSFGCQSDVDDDVDDDTIVSFDESLSLHARHAGQSSRSFKHRQQQQPRLQSIVQPQHLVVCSAARC